MDPKPNPASPFSSSPLLDPDEFRQKYLLRLLSHPLTVWPMVAGITDLLALWVFDITSGPAVFAGIFCILASVGVSASRLFTARDKVGKQVIEIMNREAREKREAALDALDARLRTDGDPRTEAFLNDLRTLSRAFLEARGAGELSSASNLDILNGVDTLFRQCVSSLEKTLQLWYTAVAMASLEARAPILRQREAIVEDVGKSIGQLGGILAAVEGIGVSGDAHDSELARVRAELDQSLEVAKKVAERMKSLDREIGLDEN